MKYEDAISELEKVINQLEDGKLSLDDSMKLFKRGVELTAECNKQLEKYEKNISLLIENADGEISKEAFGDEA